MKPYGGHGGKSAGALFTVINLLVNCLQFSVVNYYFV
jgi:hypothetical protein